MVVQQNDDGSKLTIRFQHITQGKDRGTVCRIQTVYPDGDSYPVATGMARCSERDIFSREKGRLLALTRAVALFDKEDRTKFWEAYWSGVGHNAKENNH